MTCPQCHAQSKKSAALLPSALIGVVVGTLPSALAFLIFALTGVQPVYALVGGAVIVFIVVVGLSHWLQKLTIRWTKVIPRPQAQ